MPRAPRPLRAALVASLVLLAACRRQPVDATPESVVREFVERMRRLQNDPKDARSVYELLSRPSQANLTERAKRASAATGKRMGPEQMIAPAYFFPRFQPQHWATKAAGDRATVELLGVDPAEERAAVPCVREEGRWRVDLSLPSLPPIERRPPGPGGVPLTPAAAARRRPGCGARGRQKRKRPALGAGRSRAGASARGRRAGVQLARKIASISPRTCSSV